MISEALFLPITGLRRIQNSPANSHEGRLKRASVASVDPSGANGKFGAVDESWHV